MGMSRRKRYVNLAASLVLLALAILPTSNGQLLLSVPRSSAQTEHQVGWFPTEAMAAFRAKIGAKIANLPIQFASAGENPYVSAEDVRVAALVNKKVTQFCPGVSQEDLSSERASRLKDIAPGSKNAILTILERATSNDDFQQKASSQDFGVSMSEFKQYSVGAWPAYMAIALLLLWMSCACGFVPCGCACGIPVKERDLGMPGKVVAGVIIGILSIGIAYSASMASSGYNSASGGLDNVACSSAEFVNATLSGKSSPAFIGLMPLLSQFWSLEQNLADDSAMMKDLDRILESTAPITKSVSLASQTLALLRDMMNEPANEFPTTADGQPGLHKNYAAQEMRTRIDKVIDALNSGIATALANVQDEVESQLSPEKRQELRNSLRTASEPLIESKNSLREALGEFVEDNTAYEQGRGQLNTWGPVATHILIVEAIILCIMGIATVALCACRERLPTRPDTYSPAVPHNACCTWCCGFAYAWFVFFTGAVLLTMSAPMGEVCQLLADVDGPMLTKMAPAFDITIDDPKNLSGSFNTVVRIVDNCINPKDASLNANLFDLLYEENNTKYTSFRDKYIGQMQKPIDAMFENLQSKLQQQLPKLADNVDVIAARQWLRVTPIDSVMAPDPDAFATADQFAALLLDTRGMADPTLGVQIATYTTLRCAKTTADTEYKLVGVDDFVEKFKYFGELESVSIGCARKIGTCVGGPTTQAVCLAGNKYMDLKEDLMHKTRTFRCDLFAAGTGYCDPLNMVQVDGTWRNDCFANSKTNVLKVTPRYCTLEQFVAYIEQFDMRINNVFSRLDATVPVVTQDINDKLRDLVGDYITGPVKTMADGVTCGYIATTYKRMLDGLCFQGVWGFNYVAHAYVACAWFAVVLIILMYVIWRVSKDNVAASQQASARLMNAQHDAYASEAGVAIQMQDQ